MPCVGRWICRASCSSHGTFNYSCTQITSRIPGSMSRLPPPHATLPPPAVLLLLRLTFIRFLSCLFFLRRLSGQMPDCCLRDFGFLSIVFLFHFSDLDLKTQTREHGRTRALKQTASLLSTPTALTHADKSSSFRSTPCQQMHRERMHRRTHARTTKPVLLMRTRGRKREKKQRFIF